MIRSDEAPTSGSIAILGTAPGMLAEALTTANPALEATVFGPPSQLAALQGQHGDLDRVHWEPGGPLAALDRRVDAVLFHEVLRTLPDLDVIHALGRAGAALTEGGRLHILGEVLDPALATDHDYEADLLDFALTGGGARTDVELRGLFRQAGFDVAARSTVGWGVTLYTLVKA